MGGECDAWWEGFCWVTFNATSNPGCCQWLNSAINRVPRLPIKMAHQRLWCWMLTCTRAMVLLMALYRISQAAPDSDSSPSAVTPSLPNTQLREGSGASVVWGIG